MCELPCRHTWAQGGSRLWKGRGNRGPTTSDKAGIVAKVKACLGGSQVTPQTDLACWIRFWKTRLRNLPQSPPNHHHSYCERRVAGNENQNRLTAGMQHTSHRTRGRNTTSSARTQHHFSNPYALCVPQPLLSGRKDGETKLKWKIGKLVRPRGGGTSISSRYMLLVKSAEEFKGS